MPFHYRPPPKELPLKIESPNGGKRPNYLIFMPDQLRYDSLGITAGPGGSVRTPNIDAFARGGTLFTNCFTQASVCSQSRCSMFTGRYPHVSGHRSLENLIKPWEPNMFRSLKENGYHVACLAPRGDTFAPTVTELSVSEYGFLETPNFMPGFAGGKTGGGPPKDESVWGRLFYRGLRDPDMALDYDEALVRSAVRWLECPPGGKPWVLFMPLVFPHCPFQVEEPYFSMYRRDAMRGLASRPQDKTGYEPRYMRAIRERYGLGAADDAAWREVQATYFGMISRLDEQFGRVMRALDAHAPSTVTFFFTDHGEYLGDHGLIEKWPSGLSESLVHEPLIVGGAGLPAGGIVTAITEMVDLLPTVFELSGIGEHFAHNGKSWVPLLLGQVSSSSSSALLSSASGDAADGAYRHKQYAFSEGGFLTSEEPLLEQGRYPYDIKGSLQHEDTTLVGKAISARDETWTYVYRLYEPAELYHRHDDPLEMHNLAADPDRCGVVDRFEKAVMRWLVETADVMPWESDARFPQVDLKSPREQMEERLRQAQKKAEAETPA